jgi:hypothetical protein
MRAGGLLICPLSLAIYLEPADEQEGEDGHPFQHELRHYVRYTSFRLHSVNLNPLRHSFLRYTYEVMLAKTEQCRCLWR